MYHDYNLTELEIPSSWADIPSSWADMSLLGLGEWFTSMVWPPNPLEFLYSCWYSFLCRVSFSALSWPRYGLENLSIKKEFVIAKYVLRRYQFCWFPVFPRNCWKTSWPFPPPSITPCFPSPLGNRLLGWGNALPAVDRTHFGKHSYTVVKGGQKIEVLLRQRAFYVRGPSKGQVSWLKHGGVRAAWIAACTRAGILP